jgi:hypothetical protein
MIWASFLQNQISFLKKIINIGTLGDVVANEKDISFHKKPEPLLLEVFESLPKISIALSHRNTTEKRE